MATITNVNLITSAASLLSGDLEECLTPDDDTCEGGIASVLAYARNYTVDAKSGDQEPFVVIQRFDKDSPFVNMHPLLWVMNRVILNNLFGFNVFISPPSILLQNAIDSSVSRRDISDLQSFQMPLLISNVELSSANSWYPYTEAIHFDKENGLAITYIHDNNVPLTIDHVASVKGILNYIHKLNTENRCFQKNTVGNNTTSNSGNSTIGGTAYQQYITANPLFSYPGTKVELGEDEFGNVTVIIPGTFDDPPAREELLTETKCWISVILYADVEMHYWPFLEEISQHTNPPDLVLNLEETYETFPIPVLYNSTNVWVGHCPMDDEIYCQHRITLNQDANGRHNRIASVSFLNASLEELPSDFKDDVWDSHIRKLRILANEAQANNPVIGYSGFFPVAREESYRQCNGGECQIGNLFTDAIRWFTNTDVGFTSSGGYRGPGWPEGEVRLTDVYAGLPFPNTPCVGTMSGVSLFKLFNYTTSVFADDGGRLMQVSGMRVVYNALIVGSRLISIDIWDHKAKAYLPLDRLKLYTFSTDSYVCGAYDPYPALTGGDFVIDGEVPGLIGDELIQNVVADYLGQIAEPYNSTIQGRLTNNTEVFEVMNMIQDEDSCPLNTVWSPDLLTCFACPEYELVQFADEVLKFETHSDADATHTGKTVLSNREEFDIAVLLKSNPSWVEFTKATLVFGSVENIDNTPISIKTGESLELEFKVSAASLVGNTDRTAIGTVSFAVQDGGSFPGCSGKDATFDIALRVTPGEEMNHLGSIRYIGIGLMAAVFGTAFFLCLWVYTYRNSRVVKGMQPLFLCSVSIGVAILSSAILPMSMDDGIISERGCDMACMSIPWLVSSGFTCSFAALFSKLWRINKLFHGSTRMRRVVVTHKDVLAPFIALFTLNSVFLLTWTLVDPLRWERFAVGEEEWNTYGACVGGTLSKVMLGLIGVANFGALFLACQQAYHARDISSEFSESKYIGVAIYGWLQILFITLPIFFLIQRDNPTARYFLMVCMIFIVAMSMLLIIFVPVFVNYKKQQRGEQSGQMVRVSITGIETGEDLRKKESVSRLSSLRQSFESGPRSSWDSSRGVRSGGILLLPEHLHDIDERILEDFEEIEEWAPGSEDDSAAMSIAASAARTKTRDSETAVNVPLGKPIDLAMKGMEDYDEDKEESIEESNWRLDIEEAPPRDTRDSSELSA